MFMWKACNDLLPTKMNLLRWGVVTDSLCPICLREDETIKHILWGCRFAQDVWGCGPKKLQKGAEGVSTLFSYLWGTYGSLWCSRPRAGSYSARKIWFCRNGLVHRGDLFILNKYSWKHEPPLKTLEELLGHRW
jgi:hypothetical protein